MSVTSSNLLGPPVGSVDKDYKREYTGIWRVKTNSINDTWLTVLLQSGSASLTNPVPDLWTTYAVGNDVDNGVYLQSKSAALEFDPELSKTTWLVTGVWRAPLPGKDPEQDNQPNPLNRAARYHMEFANYTKVVEKDIFGKAPVNAAKKGFDPAMEHDDSRPVLVVVRNEWPLAAIIARSIQYKNAVNTDTFYGATKRQAKMESIISSDLLIENEVRFYSVVYRIQFNDKTWDFEPVNQGYSYFETAGDDNVIEAMELDSSGNKTATPVSEPVGLAHDGTRLDDNVPKIYVETPFRIYPEQAFGPLGL